MDNLTVNKALSAVSRTLSKEYTIAAVQHDGRLKMTLRKKGSNVVALRMFPISLISSEVQGKHQISSVLVKMIGDVS